MSGDPPGRSAFWPDPPSEVPGPPVEARELVRAELDVLRALLTSADASAARSRLEDRRARHPGPTRADDVQSGFGLSSFERSVLLLTAGPAMVGELAEELRARTGTDRLTFATAMALLPDAHWDAVTPQSPLRYWGLVELDDPGDPVASTLRPAESVLHYLVGVDAPDEGLTLMSQPGEEPVVVPETYRELADEVVARWVSSSPAALRGPQQANLTLVAATACRLAGLVARTMAATDLPTGAEDLARVLRRMTRQTVLSRWAWLVDAAGSDGVVLDALARALPTCDAPLVVLLPATTGAELMRWPSTIITVPRLEITERVGVWRAALEHAGVTASEDEVAAVAGEFDLPVTQVEAVAFDVVDGEGLRGSCVRHSRTAPGGLGRVLVPRADWDALVLPEASVDQLRALVASVRHRAQVLGEWGFGERARGVGTAALFTGPSGTGKTLAAEVVAHELGRDLVVVDLSQVVSKWIGETEKNLARIFDAAEDSSTVLLFDEADALFGKRTEVKDSHDRYANIEVDFLLQRIETFTGLAILTTNARSALDRAFTRRLAAIVTFPYPDAAARERIWETALPSAMPRGDLDLARLAQVDLSGGEIAAAALQGAYLAAEAGDDVGMTHLVLASRWELGKSGRTAPRTRPDR